MDVPLPRRLFAEFLGSAFLAATVVGSGIAAAQLSPGDTGLQLLENAAATAAGLFTFILMFGPVSGCIAGAIAANLMFDLSAISIATTHRASGSHLFAEVIATLGLLLVIFSLARSGRGNLAPAAVGAYIGSAYFFTSSTSFANPAIDIGRMFSDTFAGIAPASVPSFIVFQLLGGVVGIAVIRVLYPDLTPEDAAEVMLPHRESGEGASAPAPPN